MQYTLLLYAGTNIDYVNSEGYSVLKSACEMGDIDIVRYLLSQPANPNIPVVGETPLICAVRGDYISIVQELLLAGANPNLQTNPDMWFALQSAQSEETLAMLIDAGAQTDLKDATGVSVHHSLRDDRLINMLKSAK